MSILNIIKDKNLPQSGVFAIITVSAISFISLIRNIYTKNHEARKKKASNLVNNTPTDLPANQEVNIPMVFTSDFWYATSGPNYHARMKYLAQRAALAEQLKAKIKQLELKKQQLCLDINKKKLVIKEAEARANKKKTIEQLTLTFEKKKKDQEVRDQRRFIHKIFYEKMPLLKFSHKDPVVKINPVKILFPERYIPKFKG